MKIAATFVPLLFAVPAFAQQAPVDPPAPATTMHADTLVVVTPNPPVVVTTNGAAGAGPSTIAPAKASTDAADADDPAPHNEDWNNVSHINGRPVPVGERTHYLYAYKRANISVNPISPFFNYFDGSFAYGLSQNIAISGSFGYYNKDSQQLTQVGVTLPIYFRRTFSGPFIEPGLLYRSSGSSYGGCDNTYYSCSSGDSYLGPTLMVGWHWTFDSGLNLSFAAGVVKSIGDSNNSNDSPEFNGYFRVGYAFGDAK
jgi:hypothetical protein